MKYIIILSLFSFGFKTYSYDDPRDYEYIVTTTQTGENSYRVNTERRHKSGSLGLLALKTLIMAALAYWLVTDHYTKNQKQVKKENLEFEKHKHLVADLRGENP